MIIFVAIITNIKQLMNYNLDESLGHNISILSALLKRQVFRIIAENELPITPDQWVILYYLWQKDGLSISELAVKSKKDFANLTRIIDKLVKLGYVVKRKDNADSRKTIVYVLPHAETIRHKIETCWEDATNTIEKGISVEEQRMMIDLIRRIERNVEEWLSDNRS